MTCVEQRSWTLACDARGCVATATGQGDEPWPDGWDSYFVQDEGLSAREAVRHACPAHAVGGPVAPDRPSCAHEWFAVVPSVAGRECERCAAARRAPRFHRPVSLLRRLVLP